MDWKEGIVWGIGGFTAFGLAPAIGLPPELPGTFAAALPGRQIWWVATAVATSAGLLLLAFKSGIPWKAAGVALIVLPHLIGAPQPEKHGGLAPHELMRSFVVATLMTSAIFWVVLGAAAAFFFHRQGDVEKTA